MKGLYHFSRFHFRAPLYWSHYCIVLLSRPEQIQRQITFHPGFHPVLPCHHVLPARHCFFEPSDPCFTMPPPSSASIEWWTDKVQAVSRYDANRQLRGLRARICAGDGWDLGVWDLWVYNRTAEWTVSPTCTSTNRTVVLHHQVHAYANKCKHSIYANFIYLPSALNMSRDWCWIWQSSTPLNSTMEKLWLASEQFDLTVLEMWRLVHETFKRCMDSELLQLLFLATPKPSEWLKHLEPLQCLFCGFQFEQNALEKPGDLSFQTPFPWGLFLYLWKMRHVFILHTPRFCPPNLSSIQAVGPWRHSGTARFPLDAIDIFIPYRSKQEKHLNLESMVR